MAVTLAQRLGRYIQQRTNGRLIQPHTDGARHHLTRRLARLMRGPAHAVLVLYAGNILIIFRHLFLLYLIFWGIYNN